MLSSRIFLSLCVLPCPSCLFPFFFYRSGAPRDLHSFPTRRSSDLAGQPPVVGVVRDGRLLLDCLTLTDEETDEARSEEHTSELQSLRHLVCRLLLEKKKKKKNIKKSAKSHNHNARRCVSDTHGGAV